MSYYETKDMFEYFIDKVVDLKIQVEKEQMKYADLYNKFDEYRKLKIKEDQDRV